MPGTVRLTLLVDMNGRIVGAELPSPPTKAGEREPPSARILALAGQRTMVATFPREILQLSGPGLHRLFSETRVHHDGKVVMPKFPVKRKPKRPT